MQYFPDSERVIGVMITSQRIAYRSSAKSLLLCSMNRDMCVKRDEKYSRFQTGIKVCFKGSGAKRFVHRRPKMRVEDREEIEHENSRWMDINQKCQIRH